MTQRVAKLQKLSNLHVYLYELTKAERLSH